MNDYHCANRRILLVDDHRPIHEDFQSILVRNVSASERLQELESAFFGDAVVDALVLPQYELQSAYQGQEALALVEASLGKNQPFAMAFMDVRMPPGWDGIETIQRIWHVDPRIQVVVCTAYADYTWEEIYQRFGDTSQLVFLRKPFDHTEVRQLASAVTSKWNSALWADMKRDELEKLVRERTAELEQTVSRLSEALASIKTLRGLVPICASCKQVRNDKGFWEQVEMYVTRHTEAKFSHGICPACTQKLYPELGMMAAQASASRPGAIVAPERRR